MEKKIGSIFKFSSWINAKFGMGSMLHPAAVVVTVVSEGALQSHSSMYKSAGILLACQVRLSLVAHFIAHLSPITATSRFTCQKEAYR